MKFYNREKEIEMFGKIHKDFRIAVVGRRRIGKTRLVEHFFKGENVTFFVSAEKAEKEIISDWAREHKELHLPSVDTFKEFFEFVFFHLKEKVIFIDEIQNFLKVNKSFIYDLQRLIDKYKPKLIVSGSLISVMKKIIENYKSPLYGRFDFIINLKELDFRTASLIFKDFNLDFEKAIIFYSVFGGIPKYYELLEKVDRFDLENFILESFVRYPMPLNEEVKTMLKEEFGKEHKTFFSILSSISQGKNRHSEIAGYLGRKETEITKYLSLLKEDFELIRRELPIIGSKRGVYDIKNNIVRFWFENIWRNNELLETGQEKRVVELVKKDIDKYISHGFERLILNLVSSGDINLSVTLSEIGRQWGNFAGEKGKNSYEIDLVGLNEKTREILFGECKWQDKVNALEIAKALNEKTKYVDWNNESRKEYLAIFAKSFSKRAKEFEGKKVYCFDLKDIEKLLHKKI